MKKVKKKQPWFRWLGNISVNGWFVSEAILTPCWGYAPSFENHLLKQCGIKDVKFKKIPRNSSCFTLGFSSSSLEKKKLFFPFINSRQNLLFYSDFDVFGLDSPTSLWAVR